MKRLRKWWLIWALGLILAGCGAAQEAGSGPETAVREEAAESEEDPDGLKEDETGRDEVASGRARQAGEASSEDIEEEITIVDVPVYSGKAYVEINGNIPYFTDEELSDTSYEYYEELDDLGRCGVCMASVGQDIMPTEERESIGNVKPTGWHTVKYEGIVDGNYLYNRCHLLGFQLTGENANEKNLITGTRYMNVEGMLPFENMVADYVRETGNHVMYRVTPLFEGDNLVAYGVLMEAKSVEDNGADILFHVFCYNVQPGISIDYATGESRLEDAAAAGEDTSAQEAASASAAERRKAAPPESGAQSETLQQPEQPEQPSEPDSQAQEEQMPVQETQIQQPEAKPQPAAPAGSGAYAVNGKNGKIHIVGACPATGTSGKAMTDPVYFNTYEEAEVYSAMIDPGLDKRQCGNCW